MTHPLAGLIVQVLVPGHAECAAHYALFEGPVGVQHGSALAPDLTLSIPQAALDQLERGDLDFAEAVALKRIRLTGAADKAQLLARALKRQMAVA